MNGPIPEVSVVVVSYNVRDLLCGCIDSVATSLTSASEIIVVDNGSTDDTVATVQRRFPNGTLMAIFEV